MFAFIKDKIIFKVDNYIAVGEPLAYKIQIKKDLYEKLRPGDIVELYLHLVKKEDKDELYGFGSLEELEFFETLLSVQGVGAKHALSLMNLDALENIKNAIANSDIAYLSKVSGIGSKTAKKIVFELQDKVQKTKQWNKTDEDLVDALKAMGFSLKDFSHILPDVPAELSLGEKVKFVLSKIK